MNLIEKKRFDSKCYKDNQMPLFSKSEKYISILFSKKQIYIKNIF